MPRSYFSSIKNRADSNEENPNSNHDYEFNIIGTNKSVNIYQNIAQKTSFLLKRINPICLGNNIVALNIKFKSFEDIENKKRL